LNTKLPLITGQLMKLPVTVREAGLNDLPDEIIGEPSDPLSPAGDISIRF